MYVSDPQEAAQKIMAVSQMMPVISLGLFFRTTARCVTCLASTALRGHFCVFSFYLFMA